ncbi:hypothetical protein ACFUN7_24075 [Streptomyces sp. NPDC057236]|uniref:hypothetical protein n=1 Tax=Streptomyces sp. NPDC057236 TaxID=3346059 RepID=UPI00363F249F
MTPEPCRPGSARSVAEINEEIRALWSHPQVPLTDGQREEYARLCAELRAVEREDAIAV